MGKRRWLPAWIVVALLCLCGCELVLEPPEEGPVYLLSIGLNYHGTDATYLEGPLNDEREIRGAVTWLCAQSGRQVVTRSLVQSGGRLLATGRLRPVYAYDRTDSEDLPTRSRILEELDRFGKMVEQDGLFILSFSGHGYDDGSLVTAPDNRDGRIFAESGEVDRRTLLQTETVLDRLGRMGCTTLLIVDSCYCGAFVLESSTSVSLTDNDRYLQEAFRRYFSSESSPPTVFVLAATGADNTSKEPAGEDNPHGYFTAALLEGLGWDGESHTAVPPAGRRGMVTLDDLYGYIHSHQRIPTRGTFRWEFQHPRITGGCRTPVLFTY